MTGRVIIVTGASSGIGYEAARYLCEGGNDIILACRSEEKANRAIEKIKRTNPNALATYMHLDLADLESVRKFVDDFHETGKKLHTLINNAGMVLNSKDAKRQYNSMNFELTTATNHLGPYLLTNLLLEDLKKVGAEEGGDARIIQVTSMVHDPDSMKKRGNLQPLDLDNFFLASENSYSSMQAYKNSKLMNIMFTYELARRLDGTGVTTNCVCPGFVPGTDLLRNASGAQKFFFRYVLHGMLRFTKMTRSVQQGAMAICSLASDEKYKGVTGKYFRDGAEAKSSEESLNEENQKKLWELSGGYVHLEGYEPIEVPPPPVEEEKKPEEAKEEEKEAKEGEGSKEGEAKEEDENKTDDDKKEEKTEEKSEEKEEKPEKEEKIEDVKEEKKEDEKKEEEVKVVEEEKKE